MCFPRLKGPLPLQRERCVQEVLKAIARGCWIGVARNHNEEVSQCKCSGPRIARVVPFLRCSLSNCANSIPTSLKDCVEHGSRIEEKLLA